MPIQQRGLAVYSGSNDSGNAVHKFIDDGTVQLGSSAQAVSMTVTGSVSFENSTISDLGTVTTADIDGGTIDGATIATSDITVGTGKTLDVSAGTLTLDDGQVAAEKVGAGTFDAGTYSFASSTISDLGTVTTADIDGGTIDGATIATSDITVGTGKTLNVSAGTLTTSAAQKLAIMQNAASDVDIGDYKLRAQTLQADNQTEGRVALYGAAGLLSEDVGFVFDTATQKLSNDGQISASLGISASAFYGDGSALTNVSSENVDLTAADTATEYYLPLVGASGSVDNVVMKNDSDGSLAFNTGDANNMPRLIVSGGVHLQRFNNGDNGDDAKLASLANSGDASPYNGMMIYVGWAYSGLDSSAAFFFDNGDKWYFCESGSWYPSSFNS